MEYFMDLKNNVKIKPVFLLLVLVCVGCVVVFSYREKWYTHSYLYQSKNNITVGMNSNITILNTSSQISSDYVKINTTVFCFDFFWDYMMSASNNDQTVFVKQRVRHTATGKVESPAIYGNSLWQCRNYIVLPQTIGRTGNIMFQLAALIGIAKKNNFIPVINKTPNDKFIKLFNFPDLTKRFSIVNTKKIQERKYAVYYSATECLDKKFNWTLSGYWQSWRYFANIQATIKDVFRVNATLKHKTTAYLNSISKPGTHTYLLICFILTQLLLHIAKQLNKLYFVKSIYLMIFNSS